MVDEKQVIGRLRVSRTPFREAMGMLAKGALVGRCNASGLTIQGTFIRTMIDQPRLTVS